MQPYLWLVAHNLLGNKLHVQSVKVSRREQLDYYSVNILFYDKSHRSLTGNISDSSRNFVHPQAFIQTHVHNVVHVILTR